MLAALLCNLSEPAGGQPGGVTLSGGGTWRWRGRLPSGDVESHDYVVVDDDPDILEIMQMFLRTRR